MILYAELRTHDSRWAPVKLYEQPNVENGRLKRASGIGPKIRPMGSDAEGNPLYAKEIQTGHERLTLDQLSEVYSPDGRFQNTSQAELTK